MEQRRSDPANPDATLKPSMPAGEQTVTAGHLEPFLFLWPALDRRPTCSSLFPHLLRTHRRFLDVSFPRPLVARLQHPETGKVVPARFTAETPRTQRNLHRYAEWRPVVLFAPEGQIRPHTAWALGEEVVFRAPGLAVVRAAVGTFQAKAAEIFRSLVSPVPWPEKSKSTGTTLWAKSNHGNRRPVTGLNPTTLQYIAHRD